MKRSSTMVWSVLSIGLAFVATLAGESDELQFWANWRGPLHSGVAPHGDPPTEWSETKNVRWKVELPGPGHASPVVWGDRIYVMSAVKTERTVEPEPAPAEGRGPSDDDAILLARYQETEQQQQQSDPPQQRRRRRAPPPKPTHVHQFVVTAIDRSDGKTVWSTIVREEVPHEPGHQTASQASASPITDGKRIYAFFGSRGLFCLDLDGNVQWQVDLGDMTTRNQFGEGASPVLAGKHVIVNWDHEGDSFIVALDRKSGKERWRVPRDEPTSWSTPLVVEDGKRTLVIVPGSNRVRAYDVKDGEEVWGCGGLGLNCVPTPVIHNGVVWVMSGWREMAGMAIRYPGAEGDLTDGDRVAWKLDRGLSYVPSPLLYDGQLYFLERFRGVMFSYELESGKAIFEEQRLEGIGNIYASPVGAAGRIYLIDRDGKALVLRHGKQVEILAENKLDDVFDASPAIVGDTLYLRGHSHLYAIAEN